MDIFKKLTGNSEPASEQTTEAPDRGLVGLTVLYRLDTANALEINRRRRLRAQHGNQVSAGEVVPMVVVREWSSDCVNGQVLLDGNDSLWATSVVMGDEPGQWNYR